MGLVESEPGISQVLTTELVQLEAIESTVSVAECNELKFIISLQFNVHITKSNTISSEYIT